MNAKTAMKKQKQKNKKIKQLDIARLLGYRDHRPSPTMWLVLFHDPRDHIAYTDLKEATKAILDYEDITNAGLVVWRMYRRDGSYNYLANIIYNRTMGYLSPTFAKYYKAGKRGRDPFEESKNLIFRELK